MSTGNRNTDWQANVRWLAALALLGVAVAATTFFMLARLAGPQEGSRVIAGLLQVTLLPEAGERLVATTDDGFRPGGDLQLLPGLQVNLDESEIAGFSVEQAQNRLAGVMTSRLRADGRDGLLELATDSQLLDNLHQAVSGPVRQLVGAQLGAAMLGAGLADGSRMADWRTQAANNPGAPVQPIVGVFVTADASLIESLSAAEIGELAVAGLADAFVEGGEQAARDLLANQNLLALYNEAVAGPLAAGLHGLFRTLLLGFSGELSARLASAQEALSASLEADAAQERLARGLVLESELAGLTEGEATGLVLDRLAERVHGDGPGVLQDLLADRQQQAAAASAGPLLRWFTGEAAAGHRRVAWILASLAALLVVLLVACSRGNGRLANPGMVLVLAGLPGLLLLRSLHQWLSTLGARQVAAADTGLLAGMWSDLTSLLLSLPSGVVAGAQEPWLVVTAAGVLLIVLALLAWLLPLLRPRRRYRL